MRTQTITQYIASDGSVFLDEKLCRDYEASGEAIINRMTKYVSENIGSTYCDDAGFSIIEIEDVVCFIINHNSYIQEILNNKVIK